MMRLKLAGFLIGAGGLAGLLAGCATAPPPPPPAPRPVATVPDKAALRAARELGYAEGLAAGKRIQARRDEAALTAAVVPAPAPTCPPPTAAAPPGGLAAVPPGGSAAGAAAAPLPGVSTAPDYTPGGPAVPLSVKP